MLVIPSSVTVQIDAVKAPVRQTKEPDEFCEGLQTDSGPTLLLQG